MQTFNEKLTAAGITHPDDIGCAIDYLTNLNVLLEDCAVGMPAGTILPSAVIACRFMVRTIKGHIMSAKQAESAFDHLVMEIGVDREAAERYVQNFSPRATKIAQETTNGSMHNTTIMVIALETLSDMIEQRWRGDQQKSS